MEKFKTIFSNKSTKVCVIIVFIVLFYLCLFFRPKTKEVFLRWNEASQAKAKIVSIERDWANIDLLRKKVLQSNEKIDYYEKKLPVKKEIPAILEYLSKAAKKMNVRITEIRPIEQDKPEELGSSLYYRVPILLKAECGYHQLGRFLNELENADRFMKITDIKIISKRRTDSIHDVQLIVVTYTMKK